MIMIIYSQITKNPSTVCAGGSHSYSEKKSILLLHLFLMLLDQRLLDIVRHELVA